MSVERRVASSGRVRWLARWREEGETRARTFDRKADAEAFERERRRAAQLGAHAPATASRKATGDWLREWFERDAATWARSTRIQRASVIDRWIVPFLDGVRLADLGTARVRQWRSDALAAGAPPHQVNQGLRVLSAGLTAAVEAGLLPLNPCLGIRRLATMPARPRALSPLELARLRAAMASPRDVVMLGLMSLAGLRPGEALALQWDRILGGVITVDRSYSSGELRPTKTRRRRTVEVVAPLAEDLELLPPPPRTDALVCPGRLGQPIGLHNWRNRVWVPACEAAGIAATPYDLRHTYASLLIHEGRSPMMVAATMGHASPETTWNHYVHLFEGARTLESLSDAVARARAEIRGEPVYQMCIEELRDGSDAESVLQNPQLLD